MAQFKVIPPETGMRMRLCDIGVTGQVLRVLQECSAPSANAPARGPGHILS